MRDDLEEGHEGHGGEVVHSDHPLRSLGALSNLSDRNGRGVCSEYAVGWNDFFHFFQHLVLHTDLFEHS